MYYKVVRHLENDLLVSANPTWPFSKRYEIGKWTIADIGGLLVFRTLKQAKTFIEENFSYPCWNYEIYSCDTKEQVELPFTGLVLDHLVAGISEQLDEEIKQIIASHWQHRSSSETSWQGVWPEGTVAFRKVKLLERVA